MQSTQSSVIMRINIQYQIINMEAKLSIIRGEKQYYEYCDLLEKLVFEEKESNRDDIELLYLLIEKWDSENINEDELDPIELLKAIMEQNQLKAYELAEILDVNKSTVSRIMNYQKGLSKKSIRILSEQFSISQESLNKHYKLNPLKRKGKTSSRFQKSQQKEEVA